MTSIIINPGTEPRPGNEDNAAEALRLLLAELGRDDVATFERVPAHDTEGYYAFLVREGDNSVEVDVPGCDPEITAASEPWVSPRLYVDGSSWLWGYALGFVADALTNDRSER